MITFKSKEEKFKNKMKQLFKNNEELQHKPTHHGVEWAKVIVREHQNMKDNEANFAEIEEFRMAIDILAANKENFMFYI